MTKIITAEDAIKSLREVVKRRGGNFIYGGEATMESRSCMYDAESKHGSCGVGYAVQIIRPEVYELIVDGERRSAGSFPAQEINEYIGENALSVNAKRVYQTFQNLQDAGKEYEFALASAENVYERIAEQQEKVHAIEEELSALG